MPHPPALTPARIDSLDALRGFALLGILVVNIQLFASGAGNLGLQPEGTGPLDQAVRFLVALAFEGKFYLLFSFLFGYSFTLQAQSAERDSADFPARMRRRLAMLWIFGALHAVLVFYGDILATYAVMGLVLLVWRDKNDRQLWQAACALFGVTTAVWLAIGVALEVPAAPLDVAALAADAQQVVDAYTQSASSAWQQNLRDVALAAVGLIFVQAPMALAMFCVGRVAARHGLLARPDQHAALLHRMLTWGIGIGLPGAVVYAYLSLYTPMPLLGLAMGLATAPFLTAAYVAGALLLLRSNVGHTLRRLLVPVGRMALSHYLTQSVVLAWVFYAYGLGWMGQRSPVAVLGIALALFAVQVAISRWWLRRAPYGWMEWLLRAATLGHRPTGRRPGDAG